MATTTGKYTARDMPNVPKHTELKNMKEIGYVAAMVLGAVGDALGYKNGDWEMCASGELIHSELAALGGLESIEIKPPSWIVSDDTVMHLATADSLIKHKGIGKIEKLIQHFAREYKNCMDDMENRFVGETCRKSSELLDLSSHNGYRIPFNPRGGGCGAAMRSMCIGLRYPKESDVMQLLEVSIESGRMTHHHPTGYLGALASALFVSYAVQQKPLKEWGAGLLSVINMAKLYISKSSTGYENENIREWNDFQERWQEYLRLRDLTSGRSDPIFPNNFDVSKRDKFYAYINFEGMGGSSGYDAPMIAYDALLACEGSWKQLCDRAMFHGGDSDSTGTIAGCLFGVLYGFHGVPESNHKAVEYRDRLEKVGSDLFSLAQND